jgi:hypothetical protein
MNDETIYDNQEQEVKNAPEAAMNTNENPETPNAEQTAAGKKKGVSGGAVAGIAGGAAVAAGAAGAAAAVLMPKYVFPQVKNFVSGAKDLLSDAKDFIGGYFHDGDDAVVIDDDNLLTVDTPEISDDLVGHDMDVASGVNDSMSFGEAFAAARQELGAGGLFVWHGNTYGTYYANEWNDMTPEQHDQYWADVQHTTSTIEYDPMDDSVLTNDMADADVVDVDVDIEATADLEEVELDDLAEAEVDPDIDPDNLGDTAFLVESNDLDDITEVEVNVDVDEVDEMEMADTFAVEDPGDDLEPEGLLGDETLDEGLTDSDLMDMGEDDLMADDPDLSDLA